MTPAGARAAGFAAAALLLAGCGESDTDPGPGGVTVGEARALDEAAEMIETRRLPDAALEGVAPRPSPSLAPLPSPPAAASTAPSPAE